MNKLVHTAHNTIIAPTSAAFFNEPCLLFGGGKKHVSIKSGLTIFGPRSIDIPERHPERISVGVIGTGETADLAQKWVESCISTVPGEGGNNHDFPGFNPAYGFCSTLEFSNKTLELITHHELDEIIKRIHKKKEKFEACINLISDKVRILSQKDRAPDYIIIALPDEIVENCGSVDYKDEQIGTIHRDFRKALKAELMKYRIPTQILLKKVSNAGANDKFVDHKSKCAWNFFTGLYFKAGGIPWLPTGLSKDTCYVGISFYRPLGSGNASTIKTSIAQAFDENGDGIILRGQDFLWNEREDGRAPHLNSDQANSLLKMVLRRYNDELKRPPRRVVIFKTSRYWPGEHEGFTDALRDITNFDLISISPNSQVRLVRAGNYPPLRGTRFTIGTHHFLYTTGYIPILKTYPHGHVPAPLELTDHIGDSSIDTISNEILVLSKLNWNSASFAGLMPITLTFSRLVGDIMKEIPEDREPMPQFKFYM